MSYHSPIDLLCKRRGTSNPYELQGTDVIFMFIQIIISLTHLVLKYYHYRTSFIIPVFSILIFMGNVTRKGITMSFQVLKVAASLENLVHRFI